MLFPGCRIQVVESNVVGTTGPIPGSMGFVSNFNGHATHIDFQRIVWHRYGKNGKPRIETGRFTAVVDGKLEYKIFGKRRVGKIKVLGAKGWDTMPPLEFLGWAYSILRLPKSPEQDKWMRSQLKHKFGIIYNTKGFRAENLFHADTNFENFGARYNLFKFCREWRERYYKCRIRQIKQSMAILHKHIQVDVDRAKKKYKVNHDPISFAKAVVDKKLPGPDYRYKNFVNNFISDAIIGPQANSICKDNVWIAEIVKEICKKEGCLKL